MGPGAGARLPAAAGYQRPPGKRNLRPPRVLMRVSMCWQVFVSIEVDDQELRVTAAQMSKGSMLRKPASEVHCLPEYYYISTLA